ncbi:MAG: DUF4366 domain-containing protein [Clostridia bacterium]|nr:DUF4366 domain-containing protein [Clostridia bacterium]
MMNKMDWKAWLGLIVIVMIISGFVSGFAARAEYEIPTDVEIVEDADVVVGDTADNTDTAVEDAVTDLPVEVPTEDTTEQPDDDTTQSDTPVETPDNTTQPDDSLEIPDDGTQTETPSDDPAGDSTTAPDTPTETPDEQPTDTPEQPEEPEQPPVDLKTLFDVSIKVPSGWRNTDSAAVRIKITPASDQLWHKVRYRIGDTEWKTMKNSELVLYDGYYYTDIEVYCNSKMTVRLFGDEETYFDTNKEINIFDHYAPEVTAGFRDQVLHVEAVDDLAQVAGIQVNGLLFTTLVDGTLDVRMEDPLLGYKQLAIRAYDYAGNFSAPVTLDNPYYVEPTPEPTNTPKPTTKPTKKPSTTKKPASSTKKPTATPVATSTPVVTTAPQQQIVYVTPDPHMYSYYQPQVTAEPETVYVPLGPGQPYKGEGNMQTMDMLYSASTNKQFITVQTRAGETYYMVIDYDKPIDEENEIYETYFLNLVDDRDLMSVVSEDEIQPTPTPQIVYVTPEPAPVTQQPAPIVVEDDGMEEMLPMILLIGGVAAIGGAIFWLVKKKDSSARNVPDFDDEYEFEDEEESDE